MIKIENFNGKESSGLSYGGHGGSKQGIIYNEENWFLKYPKSTKNMDVIDLSYTTSPLSEYIGSKIYEIIGVPVHKTILGICNDKIVVACKDFLSSSEVIIDYNAIINEYDNKTEEEKERISSSSNTNSDIEKVFLMMNNNKYFQKIPELKERFWEMFIIDALISNHDRNENNWGIILNKETKQLRIAPVFDNGDSFYSKSSNERLTNIYNDKVKFKQSVYDSCRSTYLLNGRRINPIKYIEKMTNIDCNNNFINIFTKIDLLKIKEMIDEIPSEYEGMLICSQIQKDFYFQSIEYKYNILKPIYDKLINK